MIPFGICVHRLGRLLRHLQYELGTLSIHKVDSKTIRGYCYTNNVFVKIILLYYEGVVLKTTVLYDKRQSYFVTNEEEES
jgi:hypothetical protein